MLKNELIGSWKQKRGGSVIHLYPDRKAVCEGHTKLGEVIREPATWEYVDDRHWNLIFNIGIETGGLNEVSEYEVVSSTPEHMEVTMFDFELPIVYERIK